MASMPALAAGQERSTSSKSSRPGENRASADPEIIGTKMDTRLRPREWCGFPGFERRMVDVKSHRGMVSE